MSDRQDLSSVSISRQGHWDFWMLLVELVSKPSENSLASSANGDGLLSSGKCFFGALHEYSELQGADVSKQFGWSSDLRSVR